MTASDYIHELRLLAVELNIAAETLIEAWTERAGVKEFSGGKSLQDAEREAFAETVNTFRKRERNR